MLNELKCIESLIRFVQSGSSLEEQISSVFEDFDEYAKVKTNLFNLISIKRILTYFRSPSFSLEEFLIKGTIKNQFKEPCVVPVIERFNSKNYNDFFTSLISALKEENFVFDEENNIYISNSKLEATIPSVWLHRLAQASKQERYETVYFFNKNQPNALRNKEGLIEYLRRTKTFIVSIDSPESTSMKAFEVAFSDTKYQVDNELKQKNEVRVDEIITLFQNILPPPFKSEISKYKMSDNYWLIKKVEEAGDYFYDKPINIQEKYLSNWIIEHISSNELANLETQRLILLAVPDIENNHQIVVDKEQVLIGLFNLYINTLIMNGTDFSTISLSDFRIKTYVPEDSQVMRKRSRLLDNFAKSRKVSIEALRQTASELLDDIQNLDLIKDFDKISQKREEYNHLLELYKKEQQESYAISRESEAIKTERHEKYGNSIESLAFDNDKIIHLINEATINGRVYISDNDLVIENYNASFSDPTFKVVINLNKLINLISDINLTIEGNALDDSDDKIIDFAQYRKYDNLEEHTTQYLKVS